MQSFSSALPSLLILDLQNQWRNNYLYLTYEWITFFLVVGRFRDDLGAKNGRNGKVSICPFKVMLEKMVPENTGGDYLQGHLVHLTQASWELPPLDKQPHPGPFNLKSPCLHPVFSKSAFGHRNLYNGEKVPSSSSFICSFINQIVTEYLLYARKIINMDFTGEIAEKPCPTEAGLG